PYDSAALAEFLGHTPEQYCSDETARAMARRALARAERLAPGRPVLGLGCTASLATDRPKRGEHRCHVALADDRHTRTTTLVFAKGARDRAAEEDVVGGLVLDLLAEAFGIAERVELALQSGECVSATAEPAKDALNAVLDGDVAAACQEIDGRLRNDA